MKILLVNTFDRGGAANACLRLHEGLLKGGVDANVLVKFKQNQNSKTFQFKQIEKNKYQRLKQSCTNILKDLKLIKKFLVSEEELYLRHRSKKLEMFSFPNSDFDITSSRLYQEADIINLHWVADFLDYESFFKKNKKPVVWTLHDMNPFTGGEHYTESFLGIDDEGFPVLRIQNKNEVLISNRILELKKEWIKTSNNLTIVTPSNWLASKAKESEVFKSRKIICIPNGVNSEVYKPRDKNYSRKLLGIPMNKKVILFVADFISNHRKGFLYLKKAFELMSKEDISLCAIGSSKIDLENMDNVVMLGTIFDERLMSIAYSAADVFVIPSLMDNLPNTVLESLLCGTPVIGFPVGGIVDMIEPKKNGLLAEEISVSSLLQTIRLFLETIDEYNPETIREEALKRYDLKIQANAYKGLFKQILQD